MTATISKEAAKEAAEKFRKAGLRATTIEAKIKVSKAEIDATYGEELATCTLKQNDALQVLERYAKQERETLLADDAKSTGFYGLTIGFRKSPSKLALKAKQTWAKVLSRIRKDPIYLERYAKLTVSVDKAAIKKSKDPDLLKTLGLKLEQEEAFFAKL